MSSSGCIGAMTINSHQKLPGAGSQVRQTSDLILLDTALDHLGSQAKVGSGRTEEQGPLYRPIPKRKGRGYAHPPRLMVPLLGEPQGSQRAGVSPSRASSPGRSAADAAGLENAVSKEMHSRYP